RRQGGSAGDLGLQPDRAAGAAGRRARPSGALRGLAGDGPWPGPARAASAEAGCHRLGTGAGPGDGGAGAGQRPAAMHGAPPDWTRRNLSAGSGVPRVDTSSSAISVFTLSAGVSPAGVWLASPYSCGAPLHSDILSYLVRPFQKVGVAQAPVAAQR